MAPERTDHVAPPRGPRASSVSEPASERAERWSRNGRSSSADESVNATIDASAAVTRRVLRTGMAVHVQRVRGSRWSAGGGPSPRSIVSRRHGRAPRSTDATDEPALRPAYPDTRARPEPEPPPAKRSGDSPDVRWGFVGTSPERTGRVQAAKRPEAGRGAAEVPPTDPQPASHAIGRQPGRDSG